MTTTEPQTTAPVTAQPAMTGRLSPAVQPRPALQPFLAEPSSAMQLSGAVKPEANGSSPIALRRHRRAPAIDLGRHAAHLAARHAWTTLALPPDRCGPPDPPGEHWSLVLGGDLAEPTLLRLIDEAVSEAASDDCDARCHAQSENILGVLQVLPSRRIRGRNVSAALLQHAPCGTLRALLEVSPVFPAGAAATILLGVAQALADLHAAGWSGVVLTLDAIAFRADGCPVLTRIDGVRRTTESATAADAAAFHSLARSVCLAVENGEGANLFAAVEGALAHRVRPSPDWRSVRAAILAAAEPTAVLVPDPVPVTVARPPLTGIGLRASTQPGRGTRSSPRSAPTALSAVGAYSALGAYSAAAYSASSGSAAAVPEGAGLAGAGPWGSGSGWRRALEQVMDALDDRPLTRLGAAAWSWLRMRPRLLAVIAIPLAALVVALIVLPTGEMRGGDGSAPPHPATVSLRDGPGFRDGQGPAQR